MALYCAYSDPDYTNEQYYICRTDQYCCEVDQCCHINSGYHPPRLWYCWFFVLTGVLVCSLISSKYCKKRQNIRHVTVSSRLPHHQPQTTIVHPSPVMPNVWAMYPPSYSASNIMVTDASGRPYPPSTEFPAQNQPNSTSDGHLHPPNYSSLPGVVPQGANNPYPSPQYNTILITDTIYEEPPSYESVVKTQKSSSVVTVN